MKENRKFLLQSIVPIFKLSVINRDHRESEIVTAEKQLEIHEISEKAL